VSRLLKMVAPFVIVLSGVAAFLTLANQRPAVEVAAAPVHVPVVEVMVVERTDVPLTVRSQGAVAPRAAIDLSAEVSGRIVEVSPDLATGSFFTRDEVLFVIDPRDYELAVARARVALRQAEVRVAREEAEAEIARRDWTELDLDTEPSPLTLRGPQLAEARAMVASAEAEVARAERDLDRTHVRAPFDGRVLERRVELGQFATRGMPAARIHGIDHVEIRLAIPVDDLAHLAIPLDYRGRTPGPDVVLHASLAGAVRTWRGEIVRSEAAIDPRTRMITLVARVADPYGRNGTWMTPLPIGLFVEAEIAGRVATDVMRVPRRAVLGRDQVLIVDDDDRLFRRQIEVVKAEHDSVVVRGGIAPGERICVSTLDAIVDGMQVRPLAAGAVRPGEAL